jgi:uncharacterized protein (DUF697 family)
MKLLQNVINHKINNATTDDLLKYADQYGISVTRKQAEKIVANVKGKNINIFDDKQRSKVVKDLAKIIGAKTAKDLNELFLQLIK